MLLLTAVKVVENMPPSRKRRKTEDFNMRRIWIALFRGVNVGGSGRVPMAELRSALTENNHYFGNVKTYIQSGNVVFTSSESKDVLRDSLGELVEERFGFRPAVMILTRDELQQASDANPYQSEASENPSKVHFFFLDGKPELSKLELIENVKADSEKYSLDQQVFYLSAPEGIGRSKLASNIERHLGVSATGRNHRTVQKLLSLAGGTG